MLSNKILAIVVVVIMVATLVAVWTVQFLGFGIYLPIGSLLAFLLSLFGFIRFKLRRGTDQPFFMIWLTLLVLSATLFFFHGLPWGIDTLQIISSFPPEVKFHPSGPNQSP